MKRKFFSFIRSSLTLLDNGKFYRKPFGWFYASVAVAFLMTPFFLVFSTIWWNNAYQDTMETKKLYEEVLLPEFNTVKYSTDTLASMVEQYGKEMNNAIDCLTKATKQADYYGEYASYGPEYQQIYNNALDVKRQWDVAYKEVADRWDAANAELDVYKAKLAKINVRHDKALAEYQAAKGEFELVNQFGTVFTLDETKNGNTIAALILFSFMALLIGALNFLLWWSRMLDLKTLLKVQDKFVATPVASHFIQTFGESLGLTVCLWGFFSALIYFTCNISMGQMGLNFTSLGIISIFIPIVVGFLIAFVFRIMAELLRTLVVLANNKGE